MKTPKAIITALLLLAAPLWALDAAPEAATAQQEKTLVHFQREGIAAAHPLAARAGLDALAAGGSAVDAAIAAQLVLGLVEPQSSGLGGGGFMLVHDARRGPRAYDGREVAPAAAKPERFLNADGTPMKFSEAVVGGLSVGVPGTVALLARSHQQHGRLPWPRLFASAIRLAEQGFAVTPRLHGLLKGETALKKDAAARAYFYQPDGQPWPVGHVLKNPAYAATLRAIAQRGPAAFYRGALATAIVNAVRAHPNAGDITEADLGAYLDGGVIERAPLCGGYRGYRVCGMPPPSSGAIALTQMLAYLEPWPLARWGAGSADSVHVFSEAGRLAFADRNRYVADADFVPWPSGLLDAAYLRQRAGLIDLQKSLRQAQPGQPPDWREARADDRSLERPGTTHLSVVDRWGNAVAMTATIESAFGSRIMVGGFLLNNELTDFSFVAAENGRPVANRVQAGKRPRSSMAPTLVYGRQGRLSIVTGSPGGSAIINYVAKTLVAMIDWRLDPQAAAALPNIGSRNGPTELERGSADEALQPALEARGHSVVVIDATSGVHTLQRSTHGWRGGADPRREGVVLGR